MSETFDHESKWVLSSETFDHESKRVLSSEISDYESKWVLSSETFDHESKRVLSSETFDHESKRVLSSETFDHESAFEPDVLVTPKTADGKFLQQHVTHVYSDVFKWFRGISCQVIQRNILSRTIFVSGILKSHRGQIVRILRTVVLDFLAKSRVTEVAVRKAHSHSTRSTCPVTKSVLIGRRISVNVLEVRGRMPSLLLWRNKLAGPTGISAGIRNAVQHAFGSLMVILALFPISETELFHCRLWCYVSF
jgi:hypothetical protein